MIEVGQAYVCQFWKTAVLKFEKKGAVCPLLGCANSSPEDIFADMKADYLSVAAGGLVPVRVDQPVSFISARSATF